MTGTKVLLEDAGLLGMGWSIASYMAGIKILQTRFATGSLGVMQTLEVLMRNLAWPEFK